MAHAIAPAQLGNESLVPAQLAYDELDTPLGRLSLVADAAGKLQLLGWLEGHRRMENMLRAYSTGAYALERRPNPHGLCDALCAYFDGDLAVIDSLPVADQGSAFQRRVWGALRSIPCGETLAYGELAMRIGNPAAVRAVGLANGANPVSIVVPCHRVIGKDGTLTGYGAGLERKRWLLNHERAVRTLYS